MTKKRVHYEEETSGATQSSWLVPDRRKEFPTLEKNISVDVAVVGAGIAGLMTAYLLAQKGKQVAVLEDGLIASGETGRTTGHLTNAFDNRYFEIAELHGINKAKLVWESHTAAIDLIEKICRTEEIACDFARVPGYLFLHANDRVMTLDKELEIAHRLGFADVKKIKKAPLSFQTGPCLLFPNQAQFHVLKFMNGLANVFIKQGGQIFTKTHIDDINRGKLETSAGKKVRAKAIVIATNAPITKSKIHTKQTPNRTYVIGVTVKNKDAPHALLWETGYPYHYIRSQPFNKKEKLVTIGGEDHRVGEVGYEHLHLARLKKWAKSRLKFSKILFAWSGQIMEAHDYLGYAGRWPKKENEYIITGDSGSGLTHGVIGALVICGLINRERNAWARLYDPARKTVGSLPKFASENARVAARYSAWLKNIKGPHDLRPGQGAVIKKGTHAEAIFRDEKGRIHSYSPICSHLKCIVRWNSMEKSFDCPCHGSRFSSSGKTINGPANKNLIKKKERSRFAS